MTAVPLRSNDVDDFLSAPPPLAVDAVRALDGDFLVLGVGGKMGASIALMLRRALAAAGKPETTVTGVSRFSRPELRDRLERQGVRTIACDLTEPEQVGRLPRVANVIYLVGQKFGTTESPETTWVQNTIPAALVARHFSASRIVAFSTGCVYPFAPVGGPGCTESSGLSFAGDYASSCIGRERIFSHYSRAQGTPVVLFRLNYAVEFRYGVLVDIAVRVRAGEPVDVTTGWFNCIWQGDACAYAIACIPHAATPPRVVNVTGQDILSVRAVAEAFGRRFGKTPRFTGTEAGTAWLADASQSVRLFGAPRHDPERMIQLVADYLLAGGEVLGRPTHFEARDGQF